MDNESGRANYWIMRKHSPRIFIPSQTLPYTFYFYLPYDKYVDQSLYIDESFYFEPITGIRGELDWEYFQINMG